MTEERNRVEKCIEAATRRLRPDPELRMDIAQELRAHIEDTIETARAAGASEGESIESALKAFGDPEAAGRELWRANRTRMRLRSVLKWATRVTLAPVAVVAVGAALLYAVESLAVVNVTYGFFGDPDTRPIALQVLGHRRLEQWAEDRVLRGGLKPNLTEDERFIADAEANAESWLDWARSLVDRFPDDPVVHGFYGGAALIAHRGWRESPQSGGRAADTVSLWDILEAFGRGERVDPQNAFYNYMKASVLLANGAETVKDPRHSREVMTPEGRVRHTAYKLIVRDRELVDWAFAEMRKGNAKPFYSSHAMDFALLRNRPLREPERLTEEIYRIARIERAFDPGPSYVKALAQGAPAYARLLIEEGDRTGALAVLEEARTPGLKVAASPDNVVQLFMGHHAVRMSLNGAALVYEDLGLSEEAERARTQSQTEKKLRHAAVAGGRDTFSAKEMKEHGGLFVDMMATGQTLRNDRIGETMRVWRMLERVMLERLALILFLTISALQALYLVVRSSVEMCVYGNDDNSPKLVFPGWRRLAVIVAISVFAPLGLYVVYTRLMPFGSAQFAVTYATARFVLEMVLFGLAILGLSLVTAYRAIRSRCEEAGMPVPKRGMFSPSVFWKAVGGVCLISLIVYAVWWRREFWRGQMGFLLAGAFALAAFVWLLVTGHRFFGKLTGDQRHFRRTFIRSLAPVFALVLIALTVASHAGLRLAERHYVRLLQRPGHRLFTDEIEMTTWKRYRDHLAEEHRKVMAARAGGDAEE